MSKIEFFYDVTSPWTYLGFVGVQPIAEEYGLRINWRPILVGGVFNAVNQSLYEHREKAFADERRMSAFIKDLGDWATYRDIKIGWPDFHPVNAVKVMRGCLAASEQGHLVDFSRLAFEAYWGELRDVSSEDVLAELTEALGMDTPLFLERIAAQDIKDQLRANTDELIERGGFGSPTLFINGDDMYFGNDRLPLVERKLRQLSLVD
jgi:2-hydroxychromene-2-carboxylate isomerase